MKDFTEDQIIVACVLICIGVEAIPHAHLLPKAQLMMRSHAIADAVTVESLKAVDQFATAKLIDVVSKRVTEILEQSSYSDHVKGELKGWLNTLTKEEK